MKKILSLIYFILISGSAYAQQDFQPGQAKVTATTLNVRNISSTGGEVVGTLNRGDIIDVIERSKSQSTVDDIEDYWYKVNFSVKKERKTGWVFGGFISFELNMESGLRWKNLSPAGGQKLSTIAISDKGEVHVGTEEGSIFITGDRGKTWKKIIPQALGVTINRINRILFMGSTIYIASNGAGKGGVWRSVNGGSSWSQFTTSQGLASNEVYDLVIESNGTLYAATDKGVSTSKDQGVSWSLISENILKKPVLAFAVSPVGQIYAGTADGLYTIQDVKGLMGGARKEWVRLGQKGPNMGERVSTIAIASNADIFVGTNKGLNRASAAKVTEWFGIGGQSTVNDILIDQSGRIIVATDNGLNISLDNGASWATYKKENGLASNKVSRIAVNKKDRTIWVISQSEGLSFHD